MKDVTGNDKAFYDDQKSTRICCLSEEIDEDFEKEKKAIAKGKGTSTAQT